MPYTPPPAAGPNRDRGSGAGHGGAARRTATRQHRPVSEQLTRRCRLRLGTAATVVRRRKSACLPRRGRGPLPTTSPAPPRHSVTATWATALRLPLQERQPVICRGPWSAGPPTGYRVVRSRVVRRAPDAEQPEAPADPLRLSRRAPPSHPSHPSPNQHGRAGSRWIGVRVRGVRWGAGPGGGRPGAARPRRPRRRGTIPAPACIGNRVTLKARYHSSTCPTLAAQQTAGGNRRRVVKRRWARAIEYTPCARDSDRAPSKQTRIGQHRDRLGSDA
jgi:hypothetical protein